MKRILTAILVGALTLSAGARIMAQEPTPSLDDLQKQIDALKKQTELLDAQKKQIEAEKALSDAKRAQSPDAAQTADLVAAAKAAKDLAEAQKSLADAQKAQSDSQLAAFKARIGDVPASGVTGGVDVKEKTGELEAALLAMRAVREAATRIGDSAHKVLPAASKVVVMSSTDVPTFQNMMAYDTEVAVVLKALDDAVNAASPPGPGVRAEAVPVFGAAGLILDATNKLLSFFRTDYVVGGITLTLDDVVALNEVAERLTHLKFAVTAPSIYDPGSLAAAAKFFVDDVTRLSVLRQKAEALIKKLDEEIGTFKTAIAAEKVETTKKALEAQLAAKTGLAAGLRSATALMDGWYSKLGAPDGKGVAALVNVAKEKSIAAAIKEGSLLVLKVQKAGGGYLTKKNLWTFFGGMPLFHMGGAAVSFTLLNGTTGAIQTAGVVPIHGGFIKAGDIRDTLK